MAKFRIIKLGFTSPLHIGRGIGESYDSSEKILHSDTIAGAITSAYCLIHKDPDAKVFMERFRVSSAYPFMDQSFFMPRPHIRTDINLTDEGDYVQKKKIKKLEFLEVTLWEKLINGGNLSLTKAQLARNGKFAFTNQAPDKVPYKDVLQQRVTVPRNGADAVPYFVERRFFPEGAGLFFFLQADKETEKEVMQSLSILGTIGFGTDKSVGNGQFIPSLEEIEIKVPADGEKCVLLSLACPEKQDLENLKAEISSYQLIRRGGFIAGTNTNDFRHLRKRSVFMFTEGSVFNNFAFAGKIENVRPEWNDGRLHPVWKDGRAFCLPVNL